MTHRREFLKNLAAMTAALSVPSILSAQNNESDKLGELLPLRRLGKTNEYVTMLGVGGYHIGWTSERDAQAVIETAIGGGVRFFDTAEQYGPAVSEERYGKYLTPKYRDHIFLMTKTQARNAKDAQQHLEDSLRRMKTDRLDLWQIHSIFSPEDVENRLAEGVLEVMKKAKESGKVKYVGFTGHRDPFAHKKMLELTRDNDPFDTVQMPVNALDQSYFSFANNVMPELLERNIGILAMKTLADGRFFGELDRANWKAKDPVIPNYMSIKEALYYSWSLPISTLITGAENVEYMQEKIELAKSFVKLSEADRLELVERVRSKAMEGIYEHYKQKPS
ncbi:aldo/keto reductase [Sunxiuqinia indica]|uniref:aldo/keto reductase n=1 Tax=Sunxiuqinia indica TaxID=2692584 RepID=UPI00135AF460|nr:aldo/keto reductase [Sunxiuqinia indica]